MSDSETLLNASPAGGGMPAGLRFRLSAMMLLQYAIWGAWWSVLSKYLGEHGLGFDGGQSGAVYGTTAVASMISPLIFGQIADRWIPTQYLLAFLHLAGAGVLYAVTQMTGFTAFYTAVLAWALLYFPTISLTNALSFQHISNVEKHFPSIRVFGTIGWIVAGWTVFVLKLDEASAQPILLAAVLSGVLGVFCFALPHTPPSGKSDSPFAFLKALGLLRDPSYALLMAVSFVIAMALAGYFAFAARFLEHVGNTQNASYMQHAAPLLTLGQCFEAIFMLAMPLLLRKLGIKWTLALGMAAWGVRYVIFGIGNPAWLVVFGVALHGICYDFFFVAAYIHTDNKASRDIRASAQAMFNFVVMGAGMLVGSLAFGELVDACTSDGGIDWRTAWFVPAGVAAAACVVFVLGFRDNNKNVQADSIATSE